ncbi:ABC transporter permease [Mucilaginibacter pocheonensis]|uniref:ABC transport system permease protein n=1 Tax=Mucilaginibacter pocheonensis TaxID=398050 RepID=A0ABU1TGH1_9SPHI|nr:FtsX-like permease family protein [Mucilaginibacter pocheonensis]MDR6944351.1 putative ABC transport system permease protein [Mucilaginibacter pocheonensis]
MLKNYFKIAIAVLRRRKFFTFISLFGISLTLTVLMVLAAFIEKLTNPAYPADKNNRSLYIKRLTYTSKKGWINSSGSSFYFLTHYAGSLKTPVKLAIVSRNNSSNAYVNNKKIVIDIKYTNADLWDIANYQFVEGKPFTTDQIKKADRVAVISERTRKEYFGDVATVVGKFIEADNISYRVTGVIKSVPEIEEVFYANMFLPYTVAKDDYRNKEFMGNYSAVLLSPSEQMVKKMRTEYEQMVARIPLPDKTFDALHSNADSYFETYTRQLFGNPDSTGYVRFIVYTSLFALLFMLLPTVNLINVNITRIMERSSEIGVRKAFGASSKTLVYQLIVENIILTIFGGIIGVILTMIILQLINSSGLLPDLDLTINPLVLLYSLLACLFFGLLSGVYPAWRMSRLDVVMALKEQ